MQLVFRRFGVLAGDATPCGQPLSMAHAHALLVLRGRGGGLAPATLSRRINPMKALVWAGIVQGVRRSRTCLGVKLTQDGIDRVRFLSEN